MLFSWMSRTVSWMWLEQQLQPQMYCSPLITLIIQGKGSGCQNSICTFVPMWCHLPHAKRDGVQLCWGITIRFLGASQTYKALQQCCQLCLLKPHASKLKKNHPDFQTAFYKLFWVLLFSDQSTVGSTESFPQTVSSSQIPHGAVSTLFTPYRPPWYQQKSTRLFVELRQSSETLRYHQLNTK